MKTLQDRSVGQRRTRLILIIAGVTAVLSLLSGLVRTQAETQTTKPMVADFDRVPPVQVTGVGPWTRYDDPAMPLDFTFEYPQNWVVGAEVGREQPYWQVIILGPRNSKNTWSAGITVRKVPTTAAGGLYADLQALIEVRKRHAMSHEFKMAAEGPQVLEPLGSIEAWRSAFSYVVALPPGSPQPTPTRIQATLLQFAFHGFLYEIRCEADAEEYAAYEPVFARLTNSLLPRRR